ncbi:class I SAM-dependent DNA methyltransferase [Mangrovitalea sediminis]|uniref:class I SAM-dependent DNA methyltransferase n=1 Tax=Mangrovitalea sediminis TaxID=1982043 RepID=UPI000BE54DCE|nr:class I SAM-dependent methyltransferase [Mangrovitalea sediminis]
MSSTALYTDLSGYYDLMCADIDYPAQSNAVHRLHQLFGNQGRRHLDLACGTGPHIRHFIDFGYDCMGLDIHQPMLDQARNRCPEARFILGDMSELRVEEPQDLITCFLYSIHYNQSLDKLKACFGSVHQALSPEGVFCFNLVDKNRINNNLYVQHNAQHHGSHFLFRSGWHYDGTGEMQSLRLRIEKTTAGETQCWQDEHRMVAAGIEDVRALLAPLFEVHVFEHDYERILPWDGESGNALLVCVKNGD